MYRLIVESLLGLKLEVDRLRFSPCLPPDWNNFALRYRYCETYYDIAVQRTEAGLEAVSVAVDGTAQEGNFILLSNDRQEHRVEVHVAASRPVLKAISA